MTTNSGLPPEMPKAPGNAKAGQPPSRLEAGGEKPHWLDPSQAKWTRERVAAIDERMKSRAGRVEVGQPQQRPVDGHRVL
jgi:hypothetical protein